ncbi:hypothetical protein MMC25_006884 [Agyrium rufum]|nr:hypothetical protein [Agyrium rufum]
MAAEPAPLSILKSKIPQPLRFPTAALMSLFLSVVLYSATSDFRAGDLASVSKRRENWVEIMGFLGCKIAELAVGWWGGYDSIDLASLTLLSHMPRLYLLTTFYGIRPSTMLASLAIDMLTTYVPFRLLRPIAATHKDNPPKDAVANRSVINDLPVRLFTTVLAACIYAVIVYGSFSSWLPIYLVTHFDGVRDISAAHSAALPFLIAAFVPVGFAAREFIFTPSTGARKDLGDIKKSAFNPVTANLVQTIQHNVWGYSKRTRTLIQRTATLAAVTGLYSWVEVYLTIDGAEGYGAAGWAAIWATAAVATGSVFWWVGDVDGITA